MEESELRQVARELKGSLLTVVGGDQRLAAGLTAEIDRALIGPASRVKRALREAFAKDPRVHQWVLDRLALVWEPGDRSVRDPQLDGEVRDGTEIDGPGGVNHRPAGPTAQPQSRYLHAQLPERVETGRRLSLVVWIARAPRTAASARLGSFTVPSAGATVTVLVSSPGLIPRGDLEADIEVPADEDSAQHQLGFLAGPLGLHQVKVDAYRSGTHLGTLLLQLSVEADATVTQGRVHTAELATVAFEPGEVTLQVSRGPDGYIFQLLGDALYGPVTAAMGDPTEQISQLAAELREMAAKRTSYQSTTDVRDRLQNLGVGLWAKAVPRTVQEQFWEQSGRIRTFSIAADRDTIPWELMYPLNGTNDNGFLVEQFPVVRRAYATRRVTTLPMGTAAYVLPPNSPTNAKAEVTSIQRQLAGRVSSRGELSQLSAVKDLLRDSPGMLHFACHNSFSDSVGSAITLDGGPWKPSDLQVSVQQRSLAAASPLVFFNACRSAGESPWFAEMDGWAGQFVEAGAGAFVGSLWAVRSSSARAFAEAFYDQFVNQRQPLGMSSLFARKAISQDSGDPTWLAYTVYGNPAAVAARAKANG